MDEPSEYDIFHNMRPAKTYIGRGFKDSLLGTRLRIASKVIDGDGGLEFATVKAETVLRETDAGRFQIKAVFLEDDRSFKTVTLQKFSERGAQKTHFTFLPHEVAKLLEFLSNVKRVNFPHEGKINIRDEDLEEMLLSPEQVKRLTVSDPDILVALARTEITHRDIVALGYRRQQLGIFRQLLNDPDFFQAEEQRVSKRGEQLWQAFFEANPWIFGYSLSMIHFGPLDNRKLEQTVRGASFLGSGKRVDGLLKSSAVISTSCFVEIKRHDTYLIREDAYRPGIWQPSSEVVGAVAQVQGTVAAALDGMGFKHHVEDGDGDPTGEIIFSAEPRSFVVAGSLAQFSGDHGINGSKFRSFELFRRNLVRPELITFDELYERAALIVATDSEEE